MRLRRGWSFRTIPRYCRLDIIQSSGDPRRSYRGTLILAIDEQHVALPKLYGAPAYARPPRPAVDTPRPFEHDDLPIEAVRTDEERDLLSTGADDAQDGNGGGPAELRPRAPRPAAPPPPSHSAAPG